MMLSNENQLAYKAGAFTVVLHLVLLVAMLISFNTNNIQSANVTEVELWDSLPNQSDYKEPPLPKLEVKEAPKPIVKEEPKPEVKPEIIDEPKVDIALEKKHKLAEEKIKKDKLEEKKLEQEKLQLNKLQLAKLQKDKIKKDEMLEKIKQQSLLDDKLDKEESNKSALDKLKKEMLADDASASKAAQSKSASAASAGEIDKYKALIQSKIQRNVNKKLCGDGNPTLEFSILLMPTGEVSGSPRLTKTSGISACDEAVERAIKVSEPLPLPTDSSLFAQFRSLKLKFHPNQDN